MRGLHSVERVLKIIGMTATSHHELDADTVNNKAALVNILLGTTVYPSCTRAQVATLAILRSDIDVRNKLSPILLGGLFKQCLKYCNKPYDSYLLFLKELIDVHHSIISHLTR